MRVLGTLLCILILAALYSGSWADLRKVCECLNMFEAATLTEAEREHHYKSLLNITAQYRDGGGMGSVPQQLPPHRGSAGYTGKWVENHFIDSFLGRPLRSFGGMFPLFVQWSDYQLRHKRKHDFRDVSMFQELKQFLRHDVIYVAVSQANYGLLALSHSHRNVLVLGANAGHVAIPLIKGEVPLRVAGPGLHQSPESEDGGSRSYSPSPPMGPAATATAASKASLSWSVAAPPPAAVDIGFYGSTDHGPRTAMLAAVRQAVQAFNLEQQQRERKLNPKNRKQLKELTFRVNSSQVNEEWQQFM